MKLKLKPLAEQVIVITGATSGIGLVTTRMAAKKGAKLVLAARDEESLSQLAKEIENTGGQALPVVAEVGNEEQVRAIAEAAIARFGGFDTWINNAGVSIYGQMLEVKTEDHRRLFDTNFWGIVYGSLEAARHLRSRQGEYGGAIINLDSTVSDRAIPIQGIYCTSKHAIKGFTDAFRMELEAEGAPISLTLIKPSSIATPYLKHVRNYMEVEPALPPPIYAPEIVAEAILGSAEKPQRDVFVGGDGKMLSILGQYFPGLGDRLLTPTMSKMQKQDEPARDRPDALYQPGKGLQEIGKGRV